MYPRSMFCEKHKKNITIFHLKITIFTAVKNLNILHGIVSVMESVMFNMVEKHTCTI